MRESRGRARAGGQAHALGCAAMERATRQFTRRLSSSGLPAVWSTASSANTSPTPTPVASVPSSPRESPANDVVVGVGAGQQRWHGSGTLAAQLLSDEEDIRMAYLRCKLTRLGQPADAVAVSADMEIPRAVLKRRGGISLNEPSELLDIAPRPGPASPNAKRPRRSASAFASDAATDTVP